MGETLRYMTSYRALIELSTLANYVPTYRSLARARARREILAFVTLCKKVVGCDVYIPAAEVLRTVMIDSREVYY